MIKIIWGRQMVDYYNTSKQEQDKDKTRPRQEQDKAKTITRQEQGKDKTRTEKDKT